MKRQKDFTYNRHPPSPTERLQRTVVDFSKLLYSDEIGNDKPALIGEHVVMGLYEASIGLHELRKVLIHFEETYVKQSKDASQQQREMFQVLTAALKPPVPMPKVGLWGRIKCWYLRRRKLVRV